MDERKAFEAWWRDQKWQQFMTKSDALVIWQAATLAERERCAKVCERERMVRGGEVFAAEIRRG